MSKTTYIPPDQREIAQYVQEVTDALGMTSQRTVQDMTELVSTLVSIRVKNLNREAEQS